MGPTLPTALPLASRSNDHSFVWSCDLGGFFTEGDVKAYDQDLWALAKQLFLPVLVPEGKSGGETKRSPCPGSPGAGGSGKTPETDQLCGVL